MHLYVAFMYRTDWNQQEPGHLQLLQIQVS